MPDIERLDGVYTPTTGEPHADGTFTWSSTTVVVGHGSLHSQRRPPLAWPRWAIAAIDIARAGGRRRVSWVTSTARGLVVDHQRPAVGAVPDVDPVSGPPTQGPGRETKAERHCGAKLHRDRGPALA